MQPRRSKSPFVSFLLYALFAICLDVSVASPVRQNCTKNCPESTLTPSKVLFTNVLQTTNNAAYNSSNGTTKSPHEKGKDMHHKAKGGIKVAKFDFRRVETPYVVCLWILLASVAKIGFHLSKRLSSFMPESCLLILLGIPVGLILRAAGLQQQTFYFTSPLFFFYLLPPIILEAGYFIPIRAFYSNIGTILLYATMGTIFNAFAIGLSLFALRGVVSVPYSLMHALLFGSLISAVDPVAVLAVFEEVQVHEILYILVFGESVLNDAASVVLYHTFEAMSTMAVIDFKQVALAIVSFFVVSLGGTLVGVIWGLATSFITRFTKHVRVIEPIFIFIMSYMAYLTAEIFHFSGIMAIFFCAIIMKPYVESNISRKSHTTIKYFMKLVSTCCETVIFMFLGVSLVMDQHRWNTSFVFLTLLFITIYRAVGVIGLTAIANHMGRVTKIGTTEQFIMSYGGLRGAVAFCLAVLLDSKHMKKELREMLITTSMVVVIFTVFVQGTTIKPLVKLLKIKRKEKKEITMAGVINDRIIDHLVAGIEEVSGHYGHGYWRGVIDYYNKKYLRPCLESNPDEALDEEIIVTNRKMVFKNALEMAKNPTALMERSGMSAANRNASYAMALAIRGNSDENQPNLDTGVLRAQNIDEQEEAIKHSISFVIPRPRAPKLSMRSRALTLRKYSLASLDEPDDEIPYRYNRMKKSALSRMAFSRKSSSHEHERKHKHHHRRKGHKKDGEERLLRRKAVSVDVSSLDRKRDISREDFSLTVDEGILFKADRHIEPQETYEMEEIIIPLPLTPGPIPACESEPVHDKAGISSIHRDGATSEGADDVEQDSEPLLVTVDYGHHAHATWHGPSHKHSLERQQTVTDDTEKQADAD